MILGLLRLTESYGPYDRIDYPGLVLASAGLFGLLYGVIRGGEIGWSTGEVIVSLAAGSRPDDRVLAWELRSPAAMLPIRFFRSRAFVTANAVSLFMYFGMFGSIFLLSQFLQIAMGYSAASAGIRTLPWTGMTLLVSPLAGPLAERVGARPLLAVGLALQAIGLAWMALIVSPTVPYGALVPPFVLMGVGMSLFFAPVALLVLNAVRPAGGGPGVGGQQRDPPARRCVRRRGSRHDLRQQRVIPLAAGVHRRPDSGHVGWCGRGSGRRAHRPGRAAAPAEPVPGLTHADGRGRPVGLTGSERHSPPSRP